MDGEEDGIRLYLVKMTERQNENLKMRNETLTFDNYLRLID